MTPVVIGTRGSALAQAQTKLMRDALRQAWPRRTFEVHIIKTQGDRLSENPELAQEKLEKGLFTGELERSLLERKIHLAVHSLKDLPTQMTEGLAITAVPKRADARDLLITRGEKSLVELPVDAQVATGSPRRAAQLLLARPDLRLVGIRGNIDTRLRKFRETPEWSALILAAAGIERLKLDTTGLTLTPLTYAIMLPAPGQGALALQTCADAADIMELLVPLNDPATHAAVIAERAFLSALGGGCEDPVGAYAQKIESNLLHLQGVAWINGEVQARRGFLKGKIDQPERLGGDLAAKISR